MKQRDALSFASVILTGPFVLALAGCTKAPPEAFPWRSSDEQHVEVLSSDYSTSRFWGCGWRGTCPEKRWKYCLRVTPHTRDAAIAWYQRYYGPEFDKARQGESEQLIRSYAAIIADYEVKLRANAFADNERAEKIVAVERLKQEVAERARFAAELEALENHDPTLVESIYQRAKAGFYLTAEYSISGAGTPKQVGTGYFFKGGCGSEGT